MYNKYIFINNNRRKKQKELEEKKKLENPQISFDMLMQMESKKEESKITKEPYKPKRNNSKRGKNLHKFVDDYVLVDIETTGLSPLIDDIIEIGAIKVKNNKMVEEYNQLININKDEMLKTGKIPEIVLEEFINFVGDSVIIGHNVNFDLSFLCDKCKKYLNYNLNNDYIDTLYLARRLVPNSVNHKLGTLAKLFNISYEGAHRGLKDVEITFEVYNKLRKLVSL